MLRPLILGGKLTLVFDNHAGRSLAVNVDNLLAVLVLNQRFLQYLPWHDLPLRLILEIKIGNLLAVGVLYDEGFLTFLDRPGRREAAGHGQGLKEERCCD